MKELKKNIIKDQILDYLKSSRDGGIYSISKNINVDVKLIAYLVEELNNDGFVELIEVTTSNEKGLPHEYLATITNKGIFFIDVDGGFKRINNKRKMEKVWQYLKIIGVVINSIAIILIGAYSLKLSSERNKLEKENIILKKTIDEINTKNSKLDSTMNLKNN